MNCSLKLILDRAFRSEQDPRLYIVKDDLPSENTSATLSVFDQMNLFDPSNDLSKRLVTSLKNDDEGRWKDEPLIFRKASKIVVR